MHIAFPAVPDLLAPLHLLMRRLMPARAATPQPVRMAAPAAPCVQVPAMVRRAGHDRKGLSALAQPAERAQRPLRVVQVMERGASRANAGRMVISGRMADVCAELDRLAAREATLH